jgi:DNA repair photolyase
VVALSGVTDPYQPAERRLELTRRCLAVLAEFKNPVVVVTKSFLVTRDVDLLAELARHDAASVLLSITTLDPELQRRMEPYAAPPGKRLAAIERLAGAGVPVGVMVAPVVPGLTDHESPRILEAAAAAGARFAGRVVLRLPHGVAELFEAWLALHYPERREKVMSRIRAVRGGKAYDPRFGVRQRGTGFWADEMGALFDLARRRAGLAERGPTLSTAHGTSRVRRSSRDAAHAALSRLTRRQIASLTPRTAKRRPEIARRRRPRALAPGGTSIARRPAPRRPRAAQAQQVVASLTTCSGTVRAFDSTKRTARPSASVSRIGSYQLWRRSSPSPQRRRAIALMV